MKITKGKPRRFDRTRRFFFGPPWPEKAFKQKLSFIIGWSLMALVFIPIFLGASEQWGRTYISPIIAVIFVGVPVLVIIRWVILKIKN